MDNTQQLLTNFIANEFLDDESKSLSMNENLIEAGVIDSLAIMLLIKYIENQFSISVEVEDVTEKNFESVIAISNLIEMRSEK